MAMNWTEVAKDAYAAYGQVTDFMNFQGNPMPTWEELPEKIQLAWQAAATTAGLNMGNMLFDTREMKQISHAIHYADQYAEAGVPGHGQFMLIAKLARRLGFM